MTLVEKYGPWAIIAGASEGTGRAFAQQLAAKGLNCLLIARRLAPLESLAKELSTEHSVECLPVSVDLYQTDAADQIIRAVADREVGLFINNAGADPHGSHFLNKPLQDWLNLINRNVTTMVRCCHHFGGLMKERERGGIILVGSGSCYGGGSFMATYSASKAFDLCFGESLWAELKPYGVEVLNLILNKTDTPALRELLTHNNLPVPDDLASPDDVARIGLERLPLGPVHNWGQEDDDKGFAPNSAAERRARIEMIDQMSKSVFGGD